MPKLQRVLNGFKWMEMATKDGRLRLPLTHKILGNVIDTKWRLFREAKAAAQAAGEQFEYPSIYSMDHPATAAAVYSSASCHFCRPGEISVRNTSKGVVTTPLLLEHHQFLYDGVDADGKKILMGQVINFPSTKTDPYGERSDRVAGLIPGSSVCATTNTVKYLHFRRDPRGGNEQLAKTNLMFPIDDGKGGLRPLSYEDLVDAMQRDLKAAGYDASHYKGHSFRIGAATSMALNGVPDHVIKDMGGWSRNSTAFNAYFGRAPQELRVRMSTFLSRAYVPCLELA